MDYVIKSAGFLLRGTATVLSALLLVSACADPEEFKGTYEEVPPLTVDRDLAYQLTLFRFGDEVGGVVRFYEFDLPPYRFNTTDNPYGEETYCRYFGPKPVSGNAISFQAEGPNGDAHVFRLSSLADDRIDVSVQQIPQDEDAPSVESFHFDLLRVSTGADRRCVAQNAYEVVAQLPPLDDDASTNLNLAVGFVGYDLDDEGHQVIVHELSDSTVVPRNGDGWAEEMRVSFPEVPPIFSAENDPLQPGVLYALAYLVLFDDNGDGVFNQFAEGSDRVLAVSLDYAVLFLDGPAENLAESVRSVFLSPELIPQGYSLHRIETEVAGTTAVVSEALLFGSTVVELTLVDDELGVFPLLVPTEER